MRMNRATWGSKTRHVEVENQYLKRLLDNLHKNINVGESTPQKELNPPEDLTDDQSLMELTTNTGKVIQKFYELEVKTRHLEVENQYLKRLLDNLHKNINVGEATPQKELKPPEDLTDDKSLMELTTNTGKVIQKFYELEVELDFIYRRMSKLSCMIVGGDETEVTPSPDRTNIFTAIGRKPRSNPAETTKQSERSLKLDKDFELVTSAWREMKEKEREMRVVAEDKQKHHSSISLLKQEKSDMDMDIQYKCTNENQNQEIEQLRQEKESLLTSVENLRAKGNNLEAVNMKLLESIKEFKREKSILKAEMRKIQYSILYLKQEMADMESHYQPKIENKSEETTQLRFNELAGARRTHDIVTIADWSDDADRPSKLSEIYSELYDNEWTDAFEELTSNMDLSEEAAVTFLLKILMNAFRKCKEITCDRYKTLKLVACTLEVKQENISSTITKETQERKQDHVGPAANEENKNICMQSTILTSTLSIEQDKLLKNIWRATSIDLKNESLKLLNANFMTSLGKQETEMPQTSKYLTRCTDLCWKMGVQEKPMHLDVNAEKEKQFDKDKFRAYMKIGKRVAYVVWPALFLHEGGAILVKGIAQGC